jgi:hypothetical protein
MPWFIFSNGDLHWQHRRWNQNLGGVQCHFRGNFFTTFQYLYRLKTRTNLTFDQIIWHEHESNRKGDKSTGSHIYWSPLKLGFTLYRHARNTGVYTTATIVTKCACLMDRQTDTQMDGHHWIAIWQAQLTKSTELIIIYTLSNICFSQLTEMQEFLKSWNHQVVLGIHLLGKNKYGRWQFLKERKIHAVELNEYFTTVGLFVLPA